MKDIIRAVQVLDIFSDFACKYREKCLTLHLETYF